jgi:hypothetical protein
MRRTLAATCLLIGMLTFALGGSTPAFADVTSNQFIPLSGADVNPCTGVAFTGTGFIHIVTHETTASDGSLHFGVDENLHFQGVDATGTTYIENGTESFTFIRPASAPGPMVFEFPTTDVIVSRGAAPSFYLHALTHITVNANGDVTASIDNLSTSC